MIKKFTSLMLIGLLLNLALYSTAKANNTEKEARIALQVKNEISKLGTGEAAKIKVKLRDKTKLSGYVSEIGEDSFTVIDKQTGNATQISYTQVKKASGKNHLNGRKILIGIGIAMFVLMCIAFASTDEF
ncbi:MAG: hypothetical protein WA584_03990 [Pyrinomonadaceae bacterium]